MCFVFIWEQTSTCATYSINWLVFIIEMKSVYCAVRTGSLNIAVCASSLKLYTVSVKNFTFVNALASSKRIFLYNLNLIVCKLWVTFQCYCFHSQSLELCLFLGIVCLCQTLFGLHINYLRCSFTFCCIFQDGWTFYFSLGNLFSLSAKWRVLNSELLTRRRICLLSVVTCDLYYVNIPLVTIHEVYCSNPPVIRKIKKTVLFLSYIQCTLLHVPANLAIFRRYTLRAKYVGGNCIYMMPDANVKGTWWFVKTVNLPYG